MIVSNFFSIFDQLNILKLFLNCEFLIKEVD